MIKKAASMLLSDGVKEIKKNVTVSYVKDINEQLKSDNKSAPAVSEAISKEEFINRYKALQYTNIGVASIQVYMLWLVVSASSFIAFLLASAFSVGLFLFYFQNSYQLWRARIVGRNWDRRNKVLTTSYSQYLSAIILKPLEFAPIKLLLK